MKKERGAFRMLSHEQRMADTKDPYHDSAKLPEPSRCPQCGASYWDGRWTWREAPRAHVHECPACRRIKDRFPAGYVQLGGPFLAEHRDDIVECVLAREARAKKEHPLQRIMGMENVAGGVLVTTTDMHLALDIARAVRRSYQGELEMKYEEGSSVLRASWTR